jgi:autotransporter-associated beta strand protein
LTSDTSFGGNGALTFRTGPWTISGGDHTLTVNNSATTTIASPIGEDIAGRSLTETGTGTLVLSGNNTFSGSVTISAGTVVLGSAGALGGLTGKLQLDPGGTVTFQAAGNKINPSADVVLNGGTLNANNFADTMGRLELSASSTINLAPADGLVRDLRFSSASHTSGTLTVNNWSGSTAGGTDDRILITAQPDVDFLTHVDFSGFPDGAYWLPGAGELVPVPEPHAYVLFGGCCLAGLASCLSRRRHPEGGGDF